MRQELKGIDAKPAPVAVSPASERCALPHVAVASLRPLLVQAQQRFVSVRPQPAAEPLPGLTRGDHLSLTGQELSICQTRPWPTQIRTQKQSMYLFSCVLRRHAYFRNCRRAWSRR